MSEPAIMTNTYYQVQSRIHGAVQWMSGPDYLTFTEASAQRRDDMAGQTRLDFRIVKFETTVLQTVRYSDSPHPEVLS